MANGDGTNNTIWAGMPWYIRALGVVGFPVVCAIYLVWLTGQALPAQMGAMLTRQNEIMVSITAYHDVAAQKWSMQEDTNKELITIARATCVNAARDETSRNRCLGR